MVGADGLDQGSEVGSGKGWAGGRMGVGRMAAKGSEESESEEDNGGEKDEIGDGDEAGRGQWTGQGGHEWAGARECWLNRMAGEETLHDSVLIKQDQEHCTINYMLHMHRPLDAQLLAPNA